MLKRFLTFLGVGAFALALPFGILAQEYDISDFDADSLGSTLDDYSGYDWTIATDELDEETAVAGLLAAMFSGVMAIVSSAFGLVMYIYMALAYSKVAKKFNMENSWFAWIPILQTILVAKMGEMNPWLLLLLLVPGVNAIFMIYFVAVTSMKISEKLGMDKYLGLLMFIPVANLILPGYWAWSKNSAKGGTPVAAPAPKEEAPAK